MKTYFTKKRLIVGIIVAVLGLMTMLTLCIPIVEVRDLELNESGFSLLDFNSEKLGLDGWFTIITGILSLLQLLLSIVAIIFSVLTIFLFNDQTAKKLWNGFSIPCFVFVAVYMLWGIIGVSTEFKYLLVDYSYYYDNIYIYYSSSIGSADWYYQCTTLSYLGFILGALLFAAYITCNIVIKDKSNNQAAETVNTDNTENEVKTEVAAVSAQNTVESSRAIAESLKLYKDLLDSGVITQEEFDIKKNEILK